MSGAPSLPMPALFESYARLRAGYVEHWTSRSNTVSGPPSTSERLDGIEVRIDLLRRDLDEVLDIARRQERESLLAEHARLTAAFDRRRR